MDALLGPPRTVGGTRKAISEACFQITHDDEHGVLFVVDNQSNASVAVKYDFNGSDNLEVVVAPDVHSAGRLLAEAAVGQHRAMNICMLRVTEKSKGYSLKSQLQCSNSEATGFRAAQQSSPHETRKSINEHLAIISKKTPTGFQFFLQSTDDRADYSISIDFSESVNFALVPAPGFVAGDTPMKISGTVPYQSERLELGSLTVVDRTAAGAKMLYKIKASKSTARWDKLQSEQRARQDVERREKEEAERSAKEEAERLAKEAAQRLAREDAERKARDDAERALKEEEARAHREAAERRMKEDKARRAKEEADRKAKADAERKAKEDEARQAKEQADRLANAKAERKVKEEADRRAKEEAERRAKEEAERRAREEAERRAKDEAERRARDALRGRKQPTCIRGRKLATALGMDGSGALTAMRREFGPINWALFEYREPLTLIEGGSQGLYEMLDHLRDDLAAVAIVRMAFGARDFRRMKYIFVQWLGDSVKPIQRAQLQQRYAAMLKALGPVNLDLTLLGERERSTEAVLKKVERVFVVDGKSDASGAVTEADYLAAIEEEQARTAAFYSEPAAFAAVKKP